MRATEKSIELLPPEEAGKCVLTRSGTLYRDDISELQQALRRDEIVFHAGCIRGAFPRVLEDR